MMTSRPNRRTFCLGSVAICTLPAASRAAEIVELEWADLIPEGDAPLPPELRGIVEHDMAPLADRHSLPTGVRTDWNGRVIRLSGFVLPLDYSGTGLTAFMLVPYVGACLHVPPPPANQLVLVTAERPYESDALFEPVSVQGRFGTTATSTELAEVGYTLVAERIVPY